MKKFSFILMALAMVMGMTQCKKENPTADNNMPVLEGETVSITLTLNNGSNNSKADVDPDGKVKFKAKDGDIPGDIIWVAYDGKNVGSLECTSLSTDNTYQNGSQLGVFTGDITITPNGDKPLYFYFLGNKTPDFVNQTINNVVVTTGYTVDLSDQSNELPVISYAMSEQTYPSTDNNYTVKYGWLKNQCALVKFECENIYDMSGNTLDNNADAIYTTTKPITIYGMKNQVTINLASPAANAESLWGTYPDWNHNLDASFTWKTKDNSNGAITLWSPSATEDVVRYAIVAPEDYSSVTQGDLSVPFDAANDNYGFFGTYKIGAQVENNAYYQDAKIDLVWHSGVFSISNSDKVVFSRGNVQYAARGKDDPNGTWRFAKHQYDWVGGMANSSTRQGTVVFKEDVEGSGWSQNENIGTSYYGWIDLFGWGTGNIPTETETYNLFYTTAGTTLNPHNGPDLHDWGKNNFVNSGKPGNTDWWTSLKKDEMVYLVDTRSSGSLVGFGEIQLSETLSVHGLVLLPDNWDNSYSFKSMNWETNAGDWTTTYNNVYTLENWRNMELHGAVFLPAAGYRRGTQNNVFDGGSGDAQNRGTYYLGDLQGINAAWSLSFGSATGDDLWISNVFQELGNDHVNPQMGSAPDNGRSVRLVHRLN